MSRHSSIDMGELLMMQERERFLSRLLRGQGIEPAGELRAFEAAQSPGETLGLWAKWGARPENLAGLALEGGESARPGQIAGMRIHTSGTDRIPEPDQHFDLALAFTLFSSVPDEDVAQGIARELFRITRPGGLIVVYDMRRQSPGNPNVHPVAEDDIRRWFPKCPLRTRSITLAPPIARFVGRYAPWLYGSLAAIPPLRTHAMYVLRRPATPPFGVVNTTGGR